MAKLVEDPEPVYARALLTVEGDLEELSTGALEELREAVMLAVAKAPNCAKPSRARNQTIDGPDALA